MVDALALPRQLSLHHLHRHRRSDESAGTVRRADRDFHGQAIVHPPEATSPDAMTSNALGCADRCRFRRFAQGRMYKSGNWVVRVSEIGVASAGMVALLALRWNVDRMLPRV